MGIGISTIVNAIKGATGATVGGFASKIPGIIDSVADAATKKDQIALEIEKLRIELIRVQDEHTPAILDAYKTEATANTEMLKARWEMEARINESPNSSWLAKNMTHMLAALVTAGTYVVFLVTFYDAPPDEYKTIVEVSTTRLYDAFILVLGYYFVSSIGSRMKDSTIARILKPKPNGQ